MGLVTTERETKKGGLQLIDWTENIVTIMRSSCPQKKPPAFEAKAFRSSRAAIAG